MAKILIAVSILFLGLSGVFGFLNTSKVKELRTEIATNVAAREMVERTRLAKEKDHKTGAAKIAGADASSPEAQARTAAAEAQMTKLLADKSDLQSKLAARETEVADMQKQLEERSVLGTAPGASITELQAQVADLRRQLDIGEKEKALLTDRTKALPERAAVPDDSVKRRETTAKKPGVRGTVLAVNQAYNFVVLNLGNRNGVEPNSDMLVLRGGTLIGKIVISSVEPATAIGDIITNSLARGVQVQPGDSVIYAGSSSAP
jgi:hypothetical protein